MTKQLCGDFVYPKDGTPRQCTRPAKYRYQVTRSRVEYLCGVHAKRFKDSPNLTPIEDVAPLTGGVD